MSDKRSNNIIVLPTNGEPARGISACLRRLQEEAAAAGLPLTAHLIETAIDAIQYERPSTGQRRLDGQRKTPLK